VGGLCEALRLSAATPGDAVNAMAQLAGFDTEADETGDALTAHLAAAALMQRMAAISMARAAATYQADSAEDAAQLRDQLLGIMDGLVDDAGDSGDDAAYQAMRTLRATIVAQVNAMGAALPALKSITLYDSTPVLALAQRLYRDPSRMDELVVRTGVINSAFIPPGTYQVLSQ
jgi:prophage DNA circulation protein